jgi:hypothetical protein
LAAEPLAARNSFNSLNRCSIRPSAVHETTRSSWHQVPGLPHATPKTA